MRQTPALSDGTYTITLVGVNQQYASTQPAVTRRFTIDSTPPNLVVNQPGSYTSGQPQYWLSGATASFQGTATDPNSSASGVANVYYKVDALGNSHASDNSSTIKSTWTITAGTSIWSVTENLGTLGEGQYTLWIAAYDNVGNLCPISSRNFGVDQNPPTLDRDQSPRDLVHQIGLYACGRHRGYELPGFSGHHRIEKRRDRHPGDLHVGAFLLCGPQERDLYVSIPAARGRMTRRLVRLRADRHGHRGEDHDGRSHRQHRHDAAYGRAQRDSRLDLGHRVYHIGNGDGSRRRRHRASR